MFASQLLSLFETLLCLSYCWLALLRDPLLGAWHRRAKAGSEGATVSHVDEARDSTSGAGLLLSSLGNTLEMLLRVLGIVPSFVFLLLMWF